MFIRATTPPLLKLVSWIAVCSLIVQMATTAYAVDIRVGVQDDAPVDIILAAGETSYNMESFTEELTAALKRAGVDTDRVLIQAAETSTMDLSQYSASEILSSWQKWGDSNANYVYNAGLNAIVDSRYHCLRSGYYDKNAEILQNSTVSIEGDITANSHSCNNYFGFTLRQNGYKDYYAVVWQDVSGTKCGMMNGQPYVGMALLKIRGCDIGDARSCKEGTFDKRCQHSTLLAQYNVGVGYQWGKKYHLKVEVDSKGFIQVWLDGKLAMSYQDNNPLPDGTYGFISVGHTAQNSNGASGTTIIFQNISVSKSSVKDLIEVVRAPNWRPNSHRFIVDVCDVPREDFQEASLITETIQRMSADNAYYCGWAANSSTETSMEKYIAKNHGNGDTFRLQNNKSHVDATAQYIAKIVNNRPNLDGRVYLHKDKEYQFTQ